MSIFSSLNIIDFQIRNLFLSAPNPFYWSPSELYEPNNIDLLLHIKNLQNKGITTIEGFVPPKIIKAVQSDLVDAQNGDRPEIQLPFSEHLKTTHIKPPLLLNDELTKLAFDRKLMLIIGNYLKRKPVLVDADFRRVFPLDLGKLNEENRQSADTWHYDNRGRQIKVMLYLTDVAKDDQNFAFCPGSHKGIKSCRLEKSRYEDAWVEKNVNEIFEIIAPAGTAVIFDTTGIHRLRRKDTRQRDSITFYYHAGFLTKNKQKISSSLYENLSAKMRRELLPVDKQV